jgi:PAS domain S-box-containing protein
MMASLVAAVPDAVVVWDLQGRIHFSNPAAERLFGYGVEELLAQDRYLLVPDENRMEEDLVFQRLSRGEEVESHQITSIRKDGTRFQISRSASPLRSPDGAVVGFATFSRAIESKDLETATASQDHFRGLVETMPQLLWSCRTDGQCDYLSPQWVEYTGIPESEQLGFGWAQQIHPDDRHQTTKQWEAASTAGTSLDVQFRIRRHDGVYRWFKTRALPQRDQHGTVLKWYGCNTDVQDLRDAHESLRKLNQELEGRIEAAVVEVTRINLKFEDLARQLQMAQRLASLGSWELDRATNEVTWSEELFRSFGLDPTLDLPLTLEEQAAVFAPESWAKLTKALNHGLQTGEGYKLELQFRHADGTPRWIIARGESLRNESGEVVGLRGTAQDVTELKLVQTQLERHSERMRLATGAARIGIWDFDVGSGLLVWDDIMHDLYGTDPQAFRGRFEDWQARVHPEDLKSAEADFKEALLSGKFFNSDFRVIRADGSVKHLRGLAMVHVRPDGKADRAVGVNWDMTKQREAELSLRASELLLRDFVRHAPAAIAMLDLDMCYLRTSDRWLTDYKLEGQDIIGRCHYDVFPDVPKHWRQIHQRVLAGAVESCNEDPFPRADGGCEWLQWEARPWREPTGQIGGLIFFTQVITARKNLELQLKTQKNELERSNYDLEQFAYAASHDLQEPLRAVSGCAQILQGRYGDRLDPEADTLIAHIVEGAARMQNLIHDLLSYSRVGREGGGFAEIDSEQALKDAIVLLGTAVRESQAIITFDPLPHLLGDPVEMRQLFQNLLGNAIKYRSSEAPKIHVSARRQGYEWEFSVKDNGIGIESRHFSRIFRLFQRLHTRTEHPGTGIGLALCQRIVNSHGGRIWVDSHFGSGSTFYFTLPTVRGDNSYDT